MKKVLSLLMAVLCIFGMMLSAGATAPDADELPFVPADGQDRPVVLDTPILISVSPLKNGVSFCWGAVDNADMYRVFRKDGKSAWAILGDTVQTSFTDTTAVSGHTYRYTVRCVSADGAAYTSGFDKNGKTITFISAPVIISLFNSYGGVKLGWSKSNGAAKYRVFRKQSNTGWKILGDTAGVAFEDKKAVSGNIYYYTIRCISADGRAYTSSYDTNGKSIRYIAAPVLKTVKNDVGGVSLAWSKSNGTQKYRVFRKGNTGGWKKLIDTTNTTYLDRSAASGNRYYYTVRCISANGASYLSAYNTSGKAVTYIAAPRVTSVTNSNLRLTIRWTKSAGAQMYRVFYKSPGGKWRVLGDTTGNSLSYNHPERTSTEYYTVRCMNKAKTAYTSAYDVTGYSFTLTVVQSGSSSGGSSGQAAPAYYVGSVKSNVYHRPDCAAAKRINSSNLIRFSSIADAKQHGYHACEICNP